MDGALSAAISGSSQKFASIEAADLGPMLERIGDSRVVLLGEASHGTSEFYRMRARITRALIEKKGLLSSSPSRVIGRMRRKSTIT